MSFESNIAKKDKYIATFRADDCAVGIYLTSDSRKVLYFQEKDTPSLRMMLVDFPEHLRRKIINDDVYEDDLAEMMNELGRYLPSFMALLEKFN